MRLLILRAAFISNVTSIASAPNCVGRTAQQSDRDYCRPCTVQGGVAHHLSDPQSLGHKASGKRTVCQSVCVHAKLVQGGA